jgi:predicted flap endonuclease-1-like 5' DNA nuclease
VNGLSLLALLIAIAAGVFAYRAGVMRGRREPSVATGLGEIGNAKRPKATAPGVPTPQAPGTAAPSEARLLVDDRQPDSESSSVAQEKARIIRSYASEMSALRAQMVDVDAAAVALRRADDERARLHRDLADARGETARYRQIVVDIENNAPPPLLDFPGAPDDLKLIVGVGPVLERMLHQLGVTTYRQIAWWTERDIDEFDARLAEFPGRIRRDGWVIQARELHQSKYGQLPARI